jgi:hypothetical protein
MMGEVLLPVGIALVIMGAIVYAVISAFAHLFGGRGKVRGGAYLICPHCGTRADPAIHTKGSTLLELFLWLCLILPGLIYSIWRVTSREQVCPTCRATGMIPVNSPRGRQLVDQAKTT